MNTLTDRGRSVKAVLVILLIAILLDKYLIAPLAPAVSGLLAMEPMLVILDIPLGLPSPCGLLPVTGLFIFLYYILIIPYHSKDRYTWRAAKARVRAVTTGMLAVPCCVVSSGLLWMAFEDRVPRQVRNAVGSIGINTDLYTAVPGYERIRLNGSMAMLAGLLIGLWIFSRKMRTAARILASETMRASAAAAAAEALRSSARGVTSRRTSSETMRPAASPGTRETIRPTAPEAVRPAAAARVPSALVSVIPPPPRNALVNTEPR
jgi:hypothetical protein